MDLIEPFIVMFKEIVHKKHLNKITELRRCPSQTSKDDMMSESIVCRHHGNVRVQGGTTRKKESKCDMFDEVTVLLSEFLADCPNWFQPRTGRLDQ